MHLALGRGDCLTLCKAVWVSLHSLGRDIKQKAVEGGRGRTIRTRITSNPKEKKAACISLGYCISH